MFHSKYMKYESLVEHSIVYGKCATEADLISMLSNLDVKLAFIIISKLLSMHWARVRKDVGANNVYDFLESAHKVHVALKDGNLYAYSSCDAVFGPQTLYQLLKWFLGHGKETKDLKVISLDDIMLIFDLCLIINDSLPKEEVVGQEKDYLNTNIFHNTPPNPLSEFGRYHYIFDVILRSQKNQRDYISIFENANSISLNQFFAETFMLLNLTLLSEWTLKNFSCTPVVFDNTDPDIKLLKCVHNDFVKMASVQHLDIKRDALGSLNKTWDFELFYRYPLVCFDKLMFPISETMLLYLVGEGLYWRLRYQEKEYGKAFMSDFGFAFEEYIKFATETVLSPCKGFARYILEFPYKFQGDSRKSTDVYIRIDNLLLAIEVKAESPHSSVLKGYNTAQLQTEVGELIVKPVKQTDRRLQELFSDDVDWLGNDEAKEFFVGIDEIVVICVSRENIQPVGDLMDYADSKMKVDDSTGSQLRTDNIKAYFNMHVNDYEVLLRLISNNINIQPLFQNWFADLRKDKNVIIPFSGLLSAFDYEYKFPEALEDFFNNRIDDLSAVIFGEKIKRPNDGQKKDKPYGSS